MYASQLNNLQNVPLSFMFLYYVSIVLCVFGGRPHII